MSDTLHKEWKYKAWDANTGTWLTGHVSVGSPVAREKIEAHIKGMFINQYSTDRINNTKVIKRGKGITQHVCIGSQKNSRKVKITKIELTPITIEEVYNPMVYLIEPVDQGADKPTGYKLTIGNEQTKAKFFEIEVLDGESSDHNECAIEALAHQIKGGRIIKR